MQIDVQHFLNLRPGLIAQTACDAKSSQRRCLSTEGIILILNMPYVFIFVDQSDECEQSRFAFERPIVRPLSLDGGYARGKSSDDVNEVEEPRVDCIVPN